MNSIFTLVTGIPLSSHSRFRNRLLILSINVRLVGIVSRLRQYVHAEHDPAKTFNNATVAGILIAMFDRSRLEWSLK